MNQKPKKHTLTESKILSESELKMMLKAIKPYMELVFPKSTGQILVNDLPPIGGENRGKEEKFKKVLQYRV